MSTHSDINMIIARQLHQDRLERAARHRLVTEARRNPKRTERRRQRPALLTRSRDPVDSIHGSTSASQEADRAVAATSAMYGCR
jgi:hypothetical protein